ncbi:MAG: bifunctional riboflavin kinase/FAD synthetase [Nitrospirae bacterium]|jgi:riboflavin kinase/FMN adenylyltransferase|nr:bifunctional riboflavin kinase/FAD synthetase [Nitrospirota bacterium]
MEIIKGLEALERAYPNTVLTIGNYDGVHLGHQKILSMVRKKAEEIKGTSVVMTFDPHPVKVLSPERDVKLLTTPEEKARLIAKMGIDILLFVTFNKEFAQIPPDDFIKDILVNKLNVKEIIVGINYAFGKGKKGNIELLKKRGKEYGFHATAVPDVLVHGNTVSSSSIRNLILKGQMQEVSVYLGRAYSILGTVIKGKGRGKSILNIPTANITTPVEIAPKEGVYAVRVGYKGSIYDGVANIGKNPTFKETAVSYEVHLFGFSGDLLGEYLRVYFIDRIRNERTFPNVAALEKQIREDIETARAILRAKNPKL